MPGSYSSFPQRAKELRHDLIDAEGQGSTSCLFFRQPDESLPFIQAHIRKIEVRFLAEEVLLYAPLIEIHPEQPMACEGIGASAPQVVQFLRHLAGRSVLWCFTGFHLAAQYVDVIGEGNGRLVVAEEKETASSCSIVEQHPAPAATLCHSFLPPACAASLSTLPPERHALRLPLASCLAPGPRVAEFANASIRFFAPGADARGSEHSPQSCEASWEDHRLSGPDRRPGVALAEADFEFGHSPAKQAGEVEITKARETEGPTGDLVGFLAGSWTGTRTTFSRVWNP